jgi:hypothetical protein
MKMIGRDGASIDVPDDQVQDAFQSGKYGFLPGAKIPMMSRLGRPFKVDPDKAEEGFNLGARLSTEDEYKKAALDAKYGDDDATAHAEAFARGFSGGATDLAAIAAARAIGGKQASQAVREHLAGEKATHETRPTEALGFGASLLVPGLGEETGTLKAAELAEHAPEAVGLLGEGANVAEASKAAGYVPGAASTVDVAGKIPTAAEEAAHASLNATQGLAPDATRAQAAASAAGTAARVASAVPSTITYAGKVTDKLVSHVIGRDAASAAGRLAQKVIAHGAAAGVEAGAFGLTNELDEEVLGDEKLNAEKLWAATRHGAVLGSLAGGVLTGVLTGGGQLARHVAGEAAPYFRRLAGEQAIRATGAKSRNIVETIIRRAGGPAELGNSVIADGALGDGPYNLPKASAPDEILANVEKIIPKRGAELGADYAASPATVDLKEVMQPFDKLIKETERTSNDSALIRHLKDQRAQTEARLVPDIAGAVAKAHNPVPATLAADEINALRKEHGVAFWDDPKKLKELGLEYSGEKGLGEKLTNSEIETLKTNPNSLPSIAELKAKGFVADFGPKGLEVRQIIPVIRREGAVAVDATLPSVAKAAENAKIPIARVIEARQAIGAEAYRSQYQNDPVGYAARMRQVYHAMNEVEDAAFTEAEKIGGGSAAALKAKRLSYQRLNIYRDLLYRGSSRLVNNNRISLLDAGVGLAGLASGHGAIGVGSALVRKLYRERGQAWTARYLDKLATLGSIQRAAAQVDREVDRGLSSVFKPGERSAPKVKLRTFTGPRTEGQDGDYNARTEAITHAVANADAHAAQVGKVASAISEHAPKTAAAYEQKGLAITSFLAGKIPQGHTTLNTLSPHLEKPRVSDAEKAKFNRAWDVANDPVGYTFDRLNKGTLTKTDVANLQAMHPEILNELRQKTIERLSTQGDKIDFDKRMQLGLLLDIPADPAIEPLFMQGMQKTYQDLQDAHNAAKPSKGRSAPKRELKAFSQKSALSV